PIAIDALELVGDAPIAWIHGAVAELERGGRPALSVQLQLHDRAGEPIAALARMRCVPASLEASLQAEAGLLARARYEVSWEPLAPASPAAPAASTPGGRWLIVSDAPGTCELL